MVRRKRKWQPRSTRIGSGSAKPSLLPRRGEEARAWSRLGVDDPHQILGANATRNPGKSITGTRKLPPKERRALDILEAKDHWTKAEIRKSYKALIKVLHPDMNGGDRGHEDQLSEVVWAWDQIKESRNFRRQIGSPPSAIQATEGAIRAGKGLRPPPGWWELAARQARTVRGACPP